MAYRINRYQGQVIVPTVYTVFTLILCLHAPLQNRHELEFGHIHQT